jgi:maltooligosyltrehalose trehalohydrolase
MSADAQKDRLGATVVPGGVRFGVWAPKAGRIDVQVESEAGPTLHRLERDGDGVHTAVVPGVGAGTRYKYRVDEGHAFPDMRSRFQPDGVHGPSEVIDPSTFPWTDGDWPGMTIDQLVVYELHVGTYTPEGTFAALQEELAEIKRLGVTAIEIMPVADFPGRWNWGYDGVAWYAPSRAYGRPDDLRRLVDAAHRVGLGVILDVVYNHFGPDGNYARVYSDEFFTGRHMTPWGEAINYDGPGSRFVRDYVIENAIHWIREYHIDGLRLDASDTIVDQSTPHILQELQERARATAGRPIVIIAEEARNSVRTIRPAHKGGYGIDAVWADDFHHELRVYLSNARENYFAHYEGGVAGMATAINEGFLYQGQPSIASGKPRGSKVTDEPASAFVFCIQNHDQVGNRPFGERLHHDINAGRYAVASALLLLAPETPMLFMGQEFSASTPFLYFTDHNEELGRLVTEGRRQEFGGFRAFHDERVRRLIPDPQAEATFQASKLDLADRKRNAGLYELYRELLALRLQDPVLIRRDRTTSRAIPVGIHALVLHRWAGDEHRLLVANFGSATRISLADLSGFDHLLGASWTPLLSTDEARFGGTGRQATVNAADGDLMIAVPARTAVLFAVTVARQTGG